MSTWPWMLALAGALPAWAQPSSAPAAPATLHAPLAALLGVVAAGAQVAQWCDRHEPAQRDQHARALRAWQATFRYAEIATRWSVTAPVPMSAERQRAFDEGLTQAAEQGFRCADLQAYLTRHLDPRRLDGPGHAALLAALDTPGVPAVASVPAAGDVWGHLPPARVEKGLRPLGAQPPLAVGGALRHGAYRCLHARLYRDDGSISATHQYTLSLYPDSGLRIDDLTINRGDGSRPSSGRELLGTYAYESASGEIAAQPWRSDDSPLKDYAMQNSEYRALRSEPLLIIAFRRVADAQGRDFLFGLQEYASRSITTCQYRGEAQQASPVAAAQAAKARADAERDRFRVAANAGLRPEQIEGYLHVARTSTDAGGALHTQEHGDLLLTSGWGFRHPAYSPHDFDAAASRRFEPQLWFRWRRQGGVIETSDDGGGWQRSPGQLQGLVRQADLTGTFQHMEIFGLNPHFAATVATTTWQFGADGRFSHSSGSRSGAFGGATTTQGRYRLEGYTLALQHDDGRSERRWIYGHGRGLVIDGTTYLRP